MNEQSHQSIFEGKYQEIYTPAAGRVRSATLGDIPLKWCKFMIEADADVTWKDVKGNSITFALKGGVPYPFFATEITACTEAVLIIHDGLQETGIE